MSTRVHDRPIRDRVENAARIVAFLCESLTAYREAPFSETALVGAQLVFWELEEELQDIRDCIVQ